MKGIDVSHHNGSVDWTKVKEDDIHFVFIKATQGIGYSKVDYFRNHAPRAAGCGLHVGAYHYATFSTIPEALAQAKYFLSVVQDYKLSYPLVLDLEENKKMVSKKQLTDAAIAFMDMIKQQGYQVMLYTSKGFLDNELDESRINYPLWIARYYKELGREADIWQHTDSGKVEGISGAVDMNIAYRDFAVKEEKPYKVIIPNTAFWQAQALVSEYEKKGYKCRGKELKVYGPKDKPQKNDPYQFIIENLNHEQAKDLVIHFKVKGYDRTYGTQK